MSRPLDGDQDGRGAGSSERYCSWRTGFGGASGGDKTGGGGGQRPLGATSERPSPVDRRSQRPLSPAPSALELGGDGAGFGNCGAHQLTMCCQSGGGDGGSGIC